MRVTDQIILSNRLVLRGDPRGEVQLAHFQKENSWFRYLPFFVQPESYTAENRNTLACFKKYLLDHMGSDRFAKVCRDVDVDLDEMYGKGTCLCEKIVAKLTISCRQISREMLQDAIDGAHNAESWTLRMPATLIADLLEVERVEQLRPRTLHQLYTYLKDPFHGSLEFSSSEDSMFAWILAKCVHALSRFIFNNYLFIKNRVLQAETNHTLCKMGFYEKMGMCFASQEDMQVGTLLRAPDDESGNPAYYRLAAKMVSANGQYSTFFLPACETSTLPPLRLTRGTAFSLSGIDALSYFITDFEEEVGRQGFESGESYERYIDSLGVERWVEIGYSVGGAIAQWRTAHQPEKVEELWTFRSPGVPERINDQFRGFAQNLGREFSIHLSRARGDFIDYGGDCHLGKDAPENVRINYSQFYIPGIPHMGLSIGGGVHFYGVEGGFTQEEINYNLDNNRRSFIETQRRFWGGQIIAPVLVAMRSVLRTLFDSRAELQKGLWMENHNAPHDQVRRIIAP